MLKRLSKCLQVALVVSLMFALLSCAKNQNGQTAQKLQSEGRYDKMYYMTSWQLSAEGQAVIMQAFNCAKARIGDIVDMAKDENNQEWTYKDVDGVKKLYHGSLPVAVISDIDDTLVNGSNYAAKIIGANGDWNNAAFARFVISDNCTALPGSVEFANYCVNNGIDFYYITNRYDQGYKIGQKDSISSYEKSIEKDGKGNYIKKDGSEIGSSIYQVFGKSFYDISFESMKKLGFPVSDQNLLINDSKLNGSSKEGLRSAIKNGCKNYPNGVRENENALSLSSTFSCPAHDVVMLLGDQTTDFTDELSSKNLDAVTRAEKAIELSKKWGNEWIMLPNGVYGTSQSFAEQYGYEKLFTYYAELNM